jgi:uncharacterized damage-inducible protein DinB
MQLAELMTLYDYNYWANRLLIDSAAQLTSEQFTQPTACSFGSLHRTLVHIMGAEWLWRMRMQERLSPPALLAAEDFPTLADVRTRWQTEEQAMRGFLAGLSAEDLTQPLHYNDTRGNQHTTPLWQVLLHLVLHGMQHRSEAAAMLTDFGHSPGNIDFILYVRTHSTT